MYAKTVDLREKVVMDKPTWYLIRRDKRRIPIVTFHFISAR
jgi:hypothetical protein